MSQQSDDAKKALPNSRDVQETGAQSTAQEIENKQVPLGPACLVVFIFGAIFLSVLLVTASWLMIGKQGEVAAKAIESTLIPFVEQSTLDPLDRNAIVEELQLLLVDIREEKLNERPIGSIARSHRKSHLAMGSDPANPETD